MFDISKLTPAQLDQFLHMQALIDRQANEAAKIIAYRAYYDGEHPTLLTRRQREYLGDLLNPEQFTFAHNLVKRVIDTIRARLAVTGVTVNGDTPLDAEESPAAEVAALLWSWWKAARLDSAQIDLYRRALRDGYAYVIVDWDNEAMRPRFTMHKRDDGRTGVLLHYDPEDESRTLFATKYFYAFDPLTPGATGKERKTVYLPAEIRKYVRGGADGTWKPYQDDGDATWPLPWVDLAGAALGCAVIEFPNPGGSEIDAIIGLQNALNKSWLDLLAAADTSGFPLIAVEYAGDNFGGATDDADLEGADEFRISPGRAIEVDNATVKRLEGANLTPMIDTMWTVVQAISGVTDIPQYYLRPTGGDVPSGEALKQLESGLVARAEERQLVFGQAWEECFKLAYKLAQTFGNVQAVDDIEIEIVWKDANVRNEQVIAQTAQVHQSLGVPEETIWQMLGYTPSQIGDWAAMKSAQDAAKLAQVATALRNSGTVNQATTNQEVEDGTI
jgi:hypothetical protein